MFCNNCGHQNEEGMIFCCACGKKLEAFGEAANAAPVTGNSYVAPAGYTLRKNRNITLQTRIISIICAVLGLLTIVFFLVPYRVTTVAEKYYYAMERSNTETKSFSYFDEIAEGFKSDSYGWLSTLMIVAMIMFCGSIIAGIVLCLLKFKWGAFFILGGALYPLCYGYDFFIRAISTSATSRTSYTVFPTMELIIGILTVMSAGVYLSIYKLKDK